MNYGFSKRYDVSKSPIDGKYRVYEWMTLSDITGEENRDGYKKMICIGIANDVDECKNIIENREANKKE